MAAVEAVDASLMVKSILEEVLMRTLPPILLIVDNKSLYDTAQTSNLISEKRLLIDMSALRQMIERGEIKMKWVENNKQLADVFTKAGANKQKLMEATSTGFIDLED